MRVKSIKVVFTYENGDQYIKMMADPLYSFQDIEGDIFDESTKCFLAFSQEVKKGLCNPELPIS